MKKLQEMLIWGTGHWSCQGEIEKYDYWGIQLGKESNLKYDPCLEQEKAKEFFKKIYPHFPDNYQTMIIPPMHVPGDPEQIEIPINLLKKIEKACEIIKEYFPQIKE